VAVGSGVRFMRKKTHSDVRQSLHPAECRGGSDG
jgi:hypothetical protein